MEAVGMSIERECLGCGHTHRYVCHEIVHHSYCPEIEGCGEEFTRILHNGSLEEYKEKVFSKELEKRFPEYDKNLVPIIQERGQARIDNKLSKTYLDGFLDCFNWLKKYLEGK